MIKAALFIKKKLDSGILTKAFHSDPVGSLLYEICLKFETLLYSCCLVV